MPKLASALCGELADEDARAAIDGVVVLATCNRVEIYLDAARFHDAVSVATATLARLCGLPSSEVGELLQLRVGEDVAAHLFAVASGLESMVVGDESISGQVGQALQNSHEIGATTTRLHRLFQTALRTARRVAADTRLGASGRSVVQVALDVVEAQAAPIAGAHVLLVGPGSFARVALGALRRRGVASISVFSSSGRADAFAQSQEIAAVPSDGLVAALAAADLVVCCSGSTGSLIDAAQLLEARGDRALPPIVDLALTPDVAYDVHQLPGAFVVDLDVVGRNAPPEHAGTVTAARALVDAAVTKFQEDAAARTLDPAVVALRDHVTQMLTREVARVRERGDSEQAAEIEHALRRLTSSLLHLPTVRARELAKSGDHADYVAALQTLFGIEVPESLRGS
ncbi:MAG: glutamyl-tRNA reductase [Jatrophihabitantaceae bacterium]|nr:glutamyl-tRNA reductase [Jatrophihabitantaceae bacterium]